MAESTFSAEEMDLYSRQIGAFGMETMMKLVRPPRSRRPVSSFVRLSQSIRLQEASLAPLEEDADVVDGATCRDGAVTRRLRLPPL